MTFLQALLIGLLYWYCRSCIGYSFCIRLNSCPMILALPIGIIMGNIPQAMIIGTFLQVVYLGIQGGFGGVLVVDKSLATCIAVPIALAAGLSSEMAVTVAFPFGMLGTLIINTFKMFTTALTHKADTYAEQGNARMIRVLAFGAPLLYLPLSIIPVTVINFFGPDMVTAILENMPLFITNGLTAVGKVLPALGFAMVMRQIGRRELLPFFFLGFFLMQYAHLTTIGAAIFGLIIAVVFIQLSGGAKNGTESAN
ncbi:PTS mannose/fructose/sorbose/N-acetylgalactosamine transporter subunit IIC [Lawsonibacter sp. LCP25S3_G6]|uniref:PTS mannose/fructose/sorbose/N-acetylgalactosamine transporter subunit IIC n=1 Tax=unclassified Lawsonibacter TaxID=2617946 RepID=UPI003F9DD55F